MKWRTDRIQSAARGAAVVALAVAVAVAIGGCGSSGGTHPGDAGGGGGGSSGDTTGMFTGDWTFGVGTVSPMCTINIGDITLTGNAVTITKLDASHVELAFANTMLTCSVSFAVSGSTASAEAGQTCTINVGVTAPFDVTSWTLTRSDSSIAVALAGTASVTVGPTTVTCKPAGSGRLDPPGVDGAVGG